VGCELPPPRQRLHTRVVPAQLTHTMHTPSSCVSTAWTARGVLGQPHGWPDRAPALVPVLLRGIGLRQLRHDPLRQLADANAPVKSLATGKRASTPNPDHR